MPKKKNRNYDGSLLGQYIRQIENPDSMGWNPVSRVWTTPTLPGYDKRNRGMGVDILNNADAKALTEGRPGRILTELEERQLRNAHIDYSSGVLNRYNKKMGIEATSPRKEAEAIGLIYRGDGLQIKNPNTLLGKAYRSDNEDDFHNAVTEYYRSKGLSERARNNDLFWQSHAEKDYLSSVVDKIQDFKNSIPSGGGIRAEGGEISSSDKLWKDLSLTEKAEMMRVAIDNGVTNLSDIKQAYNEFAKGGDTNLDDWTLQDENDYQLWRESLPINLKNTNDNQYDLRRAYKAGMEPTLEEDGKYHLGSRDPKTGRILKAPSHPTFLEAIAVDASNGYYPTVDSKGNVFTHTWKGNYFDGGGYIYDVLPGLLRKAGLNIRVSSGYRPAGKVGTSGKRSWHWRHGAVDIVPQGKTTFEDIERVVRTNPEIIEYMTANGFGYLDETNRTPEGAALMKKTGATGNHFHFGKDTRARERYQKILQGAEINPPVIAETPVLSYNEQSVPAFMPLNPEVLNAPVATYEPPTTTVEPVQPLVEAAMAYDPKELERQERKQRLQNFGTLLSLMNPSNESNDMVGLIGMLSGNKFDDGGPTNPPIAWGTGTFTPVSTA